MESANASVFKGFNKIPSKDCDALGSKLRAEHAGCHRRSESARRCVMLFVVAFFGCVGFCAQAYEVGGHHYTLAAIYLTYPNGQGGVAQSDADRLTEAFCAELPDLAMELDAVTQRLRVFLSKSDWQWGMFGRCSTKTSRHMVATQFFLHALTGSAVADVRAAALGIIKDVDRELAGARDPQERANLVCARGFAAHLLGDAFAHARLDKAGVLYSTGTGHWKDGHVPDYMLSHDDPSYLDRDRDNQNNRWSVWVEKASMSLVGRSGQDANIVNLSNGMDPNGGRRGETQLRAKLIRYAGTRWSPYEPAMESWLQTVQSSSQSIGDEFENVASAKVNATCQDQIDKGPANRSDGKGLEVPVRPQCDQVWKRYLLHAVRNFKQFGDPQSKVSSTCRIDPDRDGDASFDLAAVRE